MVDDKTFTQADIDAAIAKATGDIEGLKGKNEDLIGDNKRLKADLRKVSEIKPEDMASLEAENDKLKTDLAAAQKAAKDATTAADKATKALEQETGFTQKLLIQDGIKSALLANGVKDEDFIDSLTAKFMGGASIVAEGDVRKAMFGDKALADHIKEWAGSDVGKKFVAAPVNGGGGAQGGKAGEGGADLSKLSPVERITAARAAAAATAA